MKIGKEVVTESVEGTVGFFSFYNTFPNTVRDGKHFVIGAAALL